MVWGVDRALNDARRDHAIRVLIVTDWHLFPNIIFLQQPTNCLGYRARPNGDDPNTCIFEVFALELFPEGEEPVVDSSSPISVLPPTLSARTTKWRGFTGSPRVDGPGYSR